MIKAIIFDFAGVIATESFMIWLSENIPDFNNKKQIYLDLSYQVDSGKISAAEFSRILGKDTGKNPEDVWPEIFSLITINPSMIQLLKKLRKNYKIGLLTNHITEWITHTITSHNLAVYFDEIVISSKEKVIKPDSKIFHIMLERLGVKPSESVFIDDRQINVEGANNIGMKGLLYTTDEALMKDLASLNVKI